MVTMSQKSFVPQAAKSVSQALMSDTVEQDRWTGSLLGSSRHYSTSPGSEVCNQRGTFCSQDCPFRQSSRVRHFGTESNGTMQKFKIDLACVRAQSVTSYQVATFTGCGLGGVAPPGDSVPASGLGKRLYSRGSGKYDG